MFEKKLLNDIVYPFRYYGRLIKIVLETKPLLFILLIFITIIRALLPLFIILSTEFLITNIQHIAENYQTMETNIFSVIVPIVILVLSITLTNILKSFDNSISKSLVFWLDKKIDEIINRKISSLDIALFDSTDFLNLIKKAEKAVDYPYRLISASFYLIISLVIVIEMIILSVGLSPLLPVILIIISIPGAIINSFFNNKIHKIYLESSNDFRKESYYNSLIRDRVAASEIKILSANFFILKKWEEIRIKIINKLGKNHLLLSLWETISNIITFIAITISIIYFAALTVAGKINIGKFVVIVQIIQNLISNFSEIFNQLTIILDSNSYLDDLFQLIDLDPTKYEGILSKDIHYFIKNEKIESIIFDGVDFCYPYSKNRVLENISFEIKRGEIVALVGKNGSGKSTITKLLSRLYEPTRGRVLFNGKDIKNIDKYEIYHKVALFFQDFTRYNMSVNENIGIGDIESINSNEKIKSICRLLNIDKIIEKLPEKYEQIIGKRFSNDGNSELIDLSNGEWQKIALARALIKEQADIIILDEPNSFLDAIEEQRLYQILFNFLLDKINLFVTHRLSIVKQCSSIIFLDSGKIVDSGSYLHLISRCKEFKELYETQAKMYYKES